jgi:hypothetical protein
VTPSAWPDGHLGASHKEPFLTALSKAGAAERKAMILTRIHRCPGPARASDHKALVAAVLNNLIVVTVTIDCLPILGGSMLIGIGIATGLGSP